MIKSTYGPKCPNHGCTLTDLGFPIKSKGIGICPESGASFEYEMELDEEAMTRDKNGNMVKSKKWNVTGDENNN